ncbi:ATP-dependent helicase [Chondrinema litorale]|uniref:ATP-dependent helicase n=1 Tax=Chondrinema litorale TaxID=2994555 RepID=UPI002543CB17|nr:UvrD-helicase domain-containing protein [Chondrinema litorale]UZR92407.1 UvrD-helicase domain-containing protein [Chondrinema litorale]
MSFLDSLNEPQREAVVNTDGPLMIIAGAGSGKTRVLTYRIAYLINQGVDPFNILALTFTNKAAREMQERIEYIVGNEARNLWMGTFHSIFARILRFEANKIGFDSNFTIYDTDDSKSLLRAIIKEKKLDDKIYKVNGVLARISSAKNNLISWQAYKSNPELILEDDASRRPKIADIYQTYVMRCFKANAMDFDDLLFNTNVLFRDHLDVLNKYQHKFKYVMIDEFQDTNISQYAITRKLSNLYQNIAVVGDDAQSIYAFRGANIQNILNFEKDYPDLKTIRLEQNYRSTQNIVNAANSVIRYNENQLKKKVWTNNDHGEKLELIKAVSDGEEGRLVASSIFQEKMNHGLSNSAFCVLYRTNSQSRALEEALRSMNIKYKIIGGLSFYQRKEIKDLLAYLRFSVNPSDEEAFKRIINYPKRGIGNTSVEKILVTADEHNISVWDVVSNSQRFFGNNRLSTALEGFTIMIKSFMLAINNKDAFKAATQVAKNSGILKELYDDKTVEGRVRYENLQELLNSVKAFVDDPENEDKGLENFLQEVALYSTSDTDTDEDSVTMMTIHMSKGLEFSHVYIVGMEEDLFPSQMMLSSRADLEEERRLFYVAITRAKTRLYLSYALQRYRFGQLKPCEPSRFLEEIHFDYINTVNTISNNRPSSGFKLNKKTPTSSLKTKSNFSTNFKGKQQHKASENFTPSSPNDLKEGLRVEHLKFGFGKITSIDTHGSDKRAKVAFDNFGEKTLILSFAKLMIHE